MDAQTITPKLARELFDVSTQTITNWATEFREFLSDNAKGERRTYTQSDLEVFAMVQSYTRKGYSFEAAKEALQRGERGVVPMPENNFGGNAPAALVISLKEEITQRDEIIKTMGNEHHELIGRNKLLTEQLEAKDKRIEELYERIADLKAKK